MVLENTRLETLWNDRPKRLILGLCLLLAVGIIAVYAQTASFDFISYDDPAYVKENPKVPEGLTLDGIKWAFTSMFAGNWIPLVWVSLMLDKTIFGFWAGGFHLANVGFHIANTLLLFWVLNRYSKSVWASFFAAALFALHPLHVESVAWVTERKDVLSTLFWMLTMLAYVRYVEVSSAKRYAAVCVFFALGLMSKSMLVTLPFVLLLMDYWPLKRLLPEDAGTGVSIGRLICEKIPLVVLSAVSCLITFNVQKAGGTVMKLSSIPGFVRFINAITSYFDYIIKTFRPVDLAIFYPYPAEKIAGWKVSISIAVLLAVTVMVILLRKRRYLLVGWFWYLGTLVPVIGFVQVGLQARADRYTYIPLTGIFIMLAWLVRDIIAQHRTRRFAAAVVASAILSALGVISFVQVGYWRDTMTLFTHTAAVTSNNTAAHNSLGFCYAEKDDYDNAMREFETTLKTEPNNVIALYNVARLKDSLGKTEDAIAIYNRILTVLPGYKDACIALAAIESNRGNFKRAIDLYLDGLKYHPESGDLHGRLGSLLLQMRRVDEGIKELETAAKLKADSGIYGNLGAAMLSKGDVAKAAEYFNRAIKLNPANAEAHYNIGNIFLSQQLPAKAADEYKTAIKVKPNYAKAFSNLGVAFEQMGQLDNAIESYRRAIEADPNNVDARFNLATKLSDKGLIAEAAAEYEWILRINPADEEARAGLEKIKASKIPATPHAK